MSYNDYQILSPTQIEAMSKAYNAQLKALENSSPPSQKEILELTKMLKQQITYYKILTRPNFFGVRYYCLFDAIAQTKKNIQQITQINDLTTTANYNYIVNAPKSNIKKAMAQNQLQILSMAIQLLRRNPNSVYLIEILQTQIKTLDCLYQFKIF